MNEDRTALMSARALATGHEILWYTIREVLGQGGFGITYLAHDRNLDRQVAIKEYLPTPFAYRHQDLTVKPLTGDHNDNYAWGLDSFLKEAQTLAKFGHDNIVRVHSVFEENNTAYMVMEYELGDNLDFIYKNHSEVLDQGFFERTFFPIFDGLEQIHAFGFIHRDIKPANIYIRENGTPVLIDFGSARQTSQQQTGEMTTLVSKGYTPLEQYSANYGEQGPWTDIYALAATLYEGITGQKPDESLSRSACMLRRKPDLVQRLAAQNHPGFDQRFLDAMISGLALEPEGRPANLSDWMSAFTHGASARADAGVTSSWADISNDVPGSDTTIAREAKTAITPSIAPLKDVGFAKPEREFSVRERESSVKDSFDNDFAEGFVDDFADDFERPASGRSPAQHKRPSRKSGHGKKRGKKSGMLVTACLGIVIAASAGYYFLVQPVTSTVATTDMLAELPRPASSIATALPKEQVIEELQDMLSLAGVYQRGLTSMPSDPGLIAGIDALYEQLSTHANQWHASRHSDVHQLIARVVSVLPELGQRKSTLAAAINSEATLTSLDTVQRMLVAGNIASPAGASVLDEVNRLSGADYARLTATPDWQNVINTLQQSTLEKLEQRNFTSAARIMEAALSLEPENAFMNELRAHLSLR